MAKNGPEARSLAPRGSTLPCSSGPIELSLFDLPRPVYSAHSRTALISGLLGRRTHESLPPTHRVKCGVDAAGTEAERTSVPEPLEKVLSACQYRSTARG